MNINKDLALFYGILLGDGMIGKYKRKNRMGYINTIYISLNSNDMEFVDLVLSPVIKKLINKEIKIKKLPNKNALVIRIYNIELFKKLEDMGFPLGVKGEKLIIPEYFFKKNLIKYIIQGFFATDGSFVLTKNPNKYYPRIESKTTHPILMRQIYDYLCFVGMKGALYEYKGKMSERWKKQYRFQFNGYNNLNLFRHKIGFVNPKHEHRFHDFIEYLGKYSGTAEI